MENKTEIKSLPPLVRKQIILAQRNELTEYHLYNKLARKSRLQKNKELLGRIANDEHRHYKTWERYTGREVGANKWNIVKYYWIARIFGLTFGLKLMERNEERAQINYREIGKEIPEALKISNEENEHEKELLSLIEEDLLFSCLVTIFRWQTISLSKNGLGRW